MNNKGILSTSLSLACHTIFLMIALKMVFTPPSVPTPPPILIHVHLDSRPFSPSMGNEEHKPLEKNLAMAHETKIEKMNVPQLNMPVPYHRRIISNDNVITVVRKNMPALHSPTQPHTRKTLFSAQEVFKNMVIAHKKIFNPALMPVSDISNQIQQIMDPSVGPEMQDYPGATPYLPFDQNGSGTDIHSFLGYELYTYEDPTDNMKYFKLSIKVEEIPGSLAPLPKEITFLIDASNSIGNKLLSQFKTGIGESLQELRPDDKFNIIVFNSLVFKMHGQPVANTLDNVHQGEEFLSNFNSGSTTDLYDTVLKSVNSLHTMRPAYLFLVSDGQPTQGVTDSLQFINRIGEVNEGRVPIFGLGAGHYYNEYLMNFLTFTNHGWAEFAPFNVEDGITQMYSHMKDPVLTHLRYYSNGLDKNEIYPKLLPDLFKGSEFVLYGRFTHEGDFLFQLRGDTPTDIKQYVIKDNLNNGREGDRTIAEELAMRKIYSLIGDLHYNQNNQGLIDEVNQLAVKFDLKIPQYKTNP